jgi:hypothetical protein
VIAIADAGAPDKGYLAVWVDRSERRPHQSQAAKDRRYYKRAGDSTFVMEHYDIEDSFRRTVVPELCLSLRREDASTQGGGHGTLKTYRVVYSLQNTSLVTARFPYLHFTKLQGLYVGRYGKVGLRHRQQARRHCFDGGSDDIVHPDQSLDVASLEFGVLTRQGHRWLTDLASSTVPEQMARTPLNQAGVSFACQFGAENCRMRQVEQQISLDDLT